MHSGIEGVEDMTEARVPQKRRSHRQLLLRLGFLVRVGKTLVMGFMLGDFVVLFDARFTEGVLKRASFSLLARN